MRKDQSQWGSSKRILSSNVDAARGDDESSTMNLSIASTSCGAFRSTAGNIISWHFGASQAVVVGGRVNRSTVKRGQMNSAKIVVDFWAVSIAITVFAISRLRSAYDRPERRQLSFSR